MTMIRESFVSLVWIFPFLFLFGFLLLRRREGKGVYVRAYGGRLFTPVEWKFYRYLHNNLPEGYALLGKVRVSDLILPRRGLSKKNWGRAFSRITCKHIDFVVMERETGRVALAVELNDSSHEKKERRARDLLLEKSFEEAGLPLLFIPLKKGRWERDTARYIRETLSGESGRRETEKDG